MPSKIERANAALASPRPLWHGIMLVAGGAIGAGMFALPLVASGAWFVLSSLGLAFVCCMTYLAAKLLLDVNVRYPKGSSFDTLISDILGSRFAMVNNLSIAFIMFILMYAYITAGAGILERSLVVSLQASQYWPEGFVITRASLSLVFASIAALFISLGASSVSRISGVLMLGMCASFVAANSGLVLTLDVSTLIDKTDSSLKYLLAALPVFVTAFACAGLVPSLCEHYENKVLDVKRALLFGLLLALLVYVIWLMSTLGHISRVSFLNVKGDGGGLGALVSALQNRTDSSTIKFSLVWFSNFAVITSFLSVGLGLVHFLRDRFDLNKHSHATLRAVLLAFAPPLMGSLMAPYGFVSAIAYAGVFVAFSFFIVPALMYKAVRRATVLSVSEKASWCSVAGFGVLIIILKIAGLFSILPSYP